MHALQSQLGNGLLVWYRTWYLNLTVVFIFNEVFDWDADKDKLFKFRRGKGKVIEVYLVNLIVSNTSTHI